MAEVDGPAPAPVPQPTPADGHLSDQVPATAHTNTTREQSGSDEQSISFNRPSEGHGELWLAIDGTSIVIEALTRVVGQLIFTEPPAPK